MSKVRVSFGIAHYDDYDGAYFTLQNIRLALGDSKDYELIVIDSSPRHSEHATLLQGLCHMIGAGGTQVKYVPFSPEKLGTTQTRQMIFDVAEGEWVMVLDCHVLMPHSDLNALVKDIQTLDKLPRGIFSGSLLYDTLTDFAMCYMDEWRAEMWGTWGSIYKFPNSIYGSPYEVEGFLRIRTLGMNPYDITDEAEISRGIGYYGHQTSLKDVQNVATIPNHPPIPIAGQGLGMFLCRKEDWVGFNQHFRGFGGEEMYIHEKFRQAGMDSYCLPNLWWLHRFGRVGGAKYPLRRWDKVRNYVLGFNELKRPLDEIHKHFVETGLMSTDEWEYLVANPIEHIDPKTGSGCGCSVETQNQTPFYRILDLVRNTPRDLNEHVDFLLSYAKQCPRIVEFSKRRESTVIWFASQPENLITYHTENLNLTEDHWAEVHPDKVGCSWSRNQRASLDDFTTIDEQSFPECDLLWIDTRHTAAQLFSELKHAKKVRKYILLRGTTNNAEIGEDGQPGLFPAMRKFLQENPEWFVLEHRTEQYGITVLTRLQELKPVLPSILQMAWNYSTALASHVANGSKTVEQSVFEDRLKTCETCPSIIRGETTDQNRCSACGCFLEIKAAWEVSSCPLGKWSS